MLFWYAHPKVPAHSELAFKTDPQYVGARAVIIGVVVVFVKFAQFPWCLKTKKMLLEVFVAFAGIQVHPKSASQST